jgi:DNA-binding CsgD family transcriptional regulator
MTDAKRLLSPRQAEFLRRVCALQSNDQIARDLQISTGTINGYIRETAVALGARDRRHAALIFEDIERGASGTGAEVSIGSTASLGDEPPPPLDFTGTPRFVVRDVSTEEFLEGSDSRLRRMLREIANGSRPEGWSMLTRSALILAAVVVIGMAMLFVTAAAMIHFIRTIPPLIIDLG